MFICVERFRRRHYESSGLPSEEEPAPLQELGRRVFLVLLRAVGPEHASLAEVEDIRANQRISMRMSVCGYP